MNAKLTVFIVTSLLLVFGILLLAPNLRSLARHSSAPLRAENASWDFGTLTPSTAVCEHSFRVRNDSHLPVRIVRTVTTCGCTGVEGPKGAIAPHSEVEVKLKADWAGRSGHQNVSAYLTTDNKSAPPLILSIHGFVHLPLGITPPSLHFASLVAGERQTLRVELTSGTEERRFKVLNTAVSDNESLSVVQESTAPGSAVYAVTFAAPNYGGEAKGNIIFRTDVPDQRELVLPIRADYTPAMKVTPSYLLFLPRGRGADVEQEVHLTWLKRLGTPAVTVEQTGTEAAFSVSELQARSGHSYPAGGRGEVLSGVIKVRCVGSAPSGGTLRISCGSVYAKVTLAARDVHDDIHAHLNQSADYKVH